MMVLVVSAILAALALGVTIAYMLCCALFAVLRTRVQTQRVAPRVMQPGPATPYMPQA